MKQWMRYMVWFFFGIGVGYFAGKTIDERLARKREAEEEEESEQADIPEEGKAEEQNIESNLKDYGSTILYADGNVVNTEEDPDMPTEKDIEIDNDIPQLHPQHFVPEIISEAEYERNEWGYDYERMIYYGEDRVLYDSTTQTVIEHPDEIIGIGTLMMFNGHPNNPVESIFVKNDTFSSLIRIDFLEAAYSSTDEEIESGPEYDDPEDFTRDDGYWDDV